MWILFNQPILPSEHEKPIMVQLKLILFEGALIWLKPFLLAYIALGLGILCFIVMIFYLSRLNKK